MKRREQAYKDTTPEQALASVEDALRVLAPNDSRLSGSKRTELLAAICQYGRACAIQERALVFDELDDARKLTALRAPQ